ncbi:MAG: hypothetical protein HYW22_01800 [Candidatus Aenigmarchaeota archaeon]|nr:hypothetical protein [Candidatus Aenigmarchaeota archaeon]
MSPYDTKVKGYTIVDIREHVEDGVLESDRYRPSRTRLLCDVLDQYRDDPSTLVLDFNGMHQVDVSSMEILLQYFLLRRSDSGRQTAVLCQSDIMLGTIRNAIRRMQISYGSSYEFSISAYRRTLDETPVKLE